MKKTFLLFSLFAVFFAVAQPSLPITTVNNLKITNPILGTKHDSLMVWHGGSDKVVRFLPVSAIGGGTTPNDLNETMLLGNFTESILQFQGGAGIDFFTGIYHGYFEDNGITANQTRKLPNGTGTLALDINGNFANTAGHIALDLSGYELLSNKQTDLTASSIKYPTVNAVVAGLAGKANTSSLGAVAFSNDYNDLDNLPQIIPFVPSGGGSWLFEGAVGAVAVGDNGEIISANDSSGSVGLVSVYWQKGISATDVATSTSINFGRDLDNAGFIGISQGSQYYSFGSRANGYYDLATLDDIPDVSTKLNTDGSNANTDVNLGVYGITSFFQKVKGGTYNTTHGFFSADTTERIAGIGDIDGEGNANKITVDDNDGIQEVFIRGRNAITFDIENPENAKINGKTILTTSNSILKEVGSFSNTVTAVTTVTVTLSTAQLDTSYQVNITPTSLLITSFALITEETSEKKLPLTVTEGSK